MSRITLINPSLNTRYPQPPLGLALLAAILEKHGHSVKILDANTPGFILSDEIRHIGETEIVGITAMTPTIGAALDIAKTVKQHCPANKVIIGGPHVTLMPEETLKSSPHIDVAVRGEADDTIIEVVNALETHGSLAGINGISYLQDGLVINNPPRVALTDMDALPYPAYHLLDIEHYRPHPPHGMYLPFAAMVTSRGCPYRCAYCSKPVFGTKFRAQSAERVVDEMAYLHEKFGVKEIAFYDDSFTLDKKRVHAICDKILENNLKITWTCETRVNLVDKELLQHMKQAGCYAVAYGIETASPEIMKVIAERYYSGTGGGSRTRTTRSGCRSSAISCWARLVRPRKLSCRPSISLKSLRWILPSSPSPLPSPAPSCTIFICRVVKNRLGSFVYAGTDNPTTPVFESDKLTREDLKIWLSRAYRDVLPAARLFLAEAKRCTSWNEIKMNFKGLHAAAVLKHLEHSLHLAW